jgi:muconolactone delta-isomerase
MDTTYHYMVDFTLPSVLSDEFIDLIPTQRAEVDLLLKEGTLVNYMLALEDAKLWAVFNANSEYEVMQLIAELPLTSFMEVKISQLTMHNTPQEAMPAFSMN